MKMDVCVGWWINGNVRVLEAAAQVIILAAGNMDQRVILGGRHDTRVIRSAAGANILRSRHLTLTDGLSLVLVMCKPGLAQELGLRPSSRGLKAQKIMGRA